MGQSEPDEKLDKVIDTLAANECCSILFTVCEVLTWNQLPDYLHKKLRWSYGLPIITGSMHFFFFLFQSGTTSAPKAVMLSHDNMIFSAKVATKYVTMRFGCDRIMSYLPLSHAAAQVSNTWVIFSKFLFCYWGSLRP